MDFAMSRPIFDEICLARVFLIGVAVIGWVTWNLGIEPGDVRLVPCPFHAVTGVECPGCGMTRACTAVGQGQIEEAWHHHPLVFGLLILAVVFALASSALQLAWGKLSAWSRIAILGSGYLTVIGVWLYRILSQS